jgi:hypothetical protein
MFVQSVIIMIASQTSPGFIGKAGIELEAVGNVSGTSAFFLGNIPYLLTV